MLAQLLRQNGCSNVTIAAPGGLKMDLARQLDAADTYVELSRIDAGPQYEQIKAANPHGFDIVVEATGSVRILEDAIHYCRRGGTLVVYGYVPFFLSFFPPPFIWFWGCGWWWWCGGVNMKGGTKRMPANQLGCVCF
jgi:threonine dehydrogenase-like Zn-dependent dehydrogenase